ncbi:hypothetical protein DFJ63DRAFT_314716 [Scheffersomyces coipomensis]|uniref:uncharacterized protein n=1 Tax=Scheffersomyces coipomensis TaxID=1788519 RepID=UPI00315D5BAC
MNCPHLIYLVGDTKQEKIFNLEFDEDTMSELIKNIFYIQVSSYDEVLLDIAYRSLDNYQNMYFIKIKDQEYHLKAKSVGIERYNICDTDDILNVLFFTSNDIYSCENIRHIPEIDIFDTRSSVYIHKKYNITLPEDLFEVIEIDNENEIMEIEHKRDHFYKNIYLYINDENKIIMRNIRDSFNKIREFDSINDEVINIIRDEDGSRW